MPEIACILLNYRNPEDTLACLRSFLDDGVRGFRFYVVNNHAADGSGEALRGFLESSGLPHQYLEPGENLGYTGGVNLGVSRALADGAGHVMLLNNDTAVSRGFCEAALAAARDYPDRVLAGWVADWETGEPSANTGRITPWALHVRRILDPRDTGDFDFVSGCLMVVPAAVFRKVGLLDDRYFMYREDLDFCLRLKAAGVKLLYVPAMSIRHKVSSAADRTSTPKEYYRVRNQTHIVWRHGKPLQRLAYLGFIALVLAYNARRPAIFSAFARGVLDAFRGRLGKAK